MRWVGVTHALTEERRKASGSLGGRRHSSLSSYAPLLRSLARIASCDHASNAAYRPPLQTFALLRPSPPSSAHPPLFFPRTLPCI